LFKFATATQLRFRLRRVERGYTEHGQRIRRHERHESASPFRRRECVIAVRSKLEKELFHDEIIPGTRVFLPSGVGHRERRGGGGPRRAGRRRLLLELEYEHHAAED
jgi:hypothetical protein